MAFIAYLLRKLRRLHLRLDDLERNNVSSGPAAVVSLCAVADGETAFSERRASRIIDARRLGDNWGRRLSVDGRHGRCRWPGMHNSLCLSSLSSLSALDWTISTKDGRWLSLRLHTLGRRCHGRPLRCEKLGSLPACSTLRFRSSRCTDEDDIAVIARKLPYCCRRCITVIKSNVLNVDHNGLPRP